MSVLVPPMSNVTIRSASTSVPSWRPKMTPAAGPESSVWLGKRLPTSIRISPPCDCITYFCGVATPTASSWSSSAARYVSMIGPTYASSTVVAMRGYSRIVGRISLESETRSCGATSRMIAAVSFSCAASMNENR